MEMKKLDLSGEKKNILIDALAEAARPLSQDMGRIYDITRSQALDVRTDRIALTAAQKNITISALKTWLKSHPGDPRSTTAARMLDRLELTRKQYNAKYQPEK